MFWDAWYQFQAWMTSISIFTAMSAKFIASEHQSFVESHQDCFSNGKCNQMGWICKSILEQKTQINGTKQHIFKDGTWSYYRDRQSINKYKISYFPELGVFVPLLLSSLLPGRCLAYISANSGFPEIFVLCLFFVANLWS